MVGPRKSIKQVKPRPVNTPTVRTEFYLNKIVQGQSFLTVARYLSTRSIYLKALIEPASAQAAQCVDLEFQLPNTNQTIWAKGCIVPPSASMPEQGLTEVRFVQLRQEHQQLIAAYVDEALKLADPQAA